MNSSRLLWQDQLARGTRQLEIELRGWQIGRLLDYLELLQRWNKAFNLTAVRDPAQMVPRHLLDSLSIAPWVVGERLLDVGTGAGLPGIPLAILNPDMHCTLLDSNGKKTRFVRQVVMELDLGNVEVVQERIEDHVCPSPYPLITARAFASLVDLVNLTDRLLASGGVLLAMKGVLPLQEVRSLERLGGRLDQHRLSVPQVEGQRHLIRLVK